jgi:DNA-binding transcriptional regulator YiaG
MVSLNSKEAAKMLLNEKISIIRKMNNMTQERFAEELGVSRQAVSKWQNAMKRNWRPKRKIYLILT